MTPTVAFGVERIRGWDPTPAERRLAAVAEELAELVTRAEAGLVAQPPQLVHGDFWDNNVGFRGGWVARLDDKAAARRHFAGVAPELVAARRLMTELGRWQDAFA
jgi:hypothetical protein